MAIDGKTGPDSSNPQRDRRTSESQSQDPVNPSSKPQRIGIQQSDHSSAAGGATGGGSGGGAADGASMQPPLGAQNVNIMAMLTKAKDQYDMVGVRCK